MKIQCLTALCLHRVNFTLLAREALHYSLPACVQIIAFHSTLTLDHPSRNPFSLLSKHQIIVVVAQEMMVSVLSSILFSWLRKVNSIEDQHGQQNSQCFKACQGHHHVVLNIKTTDKEPCRDFHKPMRKILVYAPR